MKKASQCIIYNLEDISNSSSDKYIRKVIYNNINMIKKMNNSGFLATINTFYLGFPSLAEIKGNMWLKTEGNLPSVSQQKEKPGLR